MTHMELKSWEDFEKKISNLSERPQWLQPRLFRGQREASWHLETTLERHLRELKTTNIDYPVDLYRQKILSVLGQIEAVIGKKVEIADEHRLDDNYSTAPKSYELMAFLRQNGHHSPLLDWSRSPYIAAFFAFKKANLKDGQFVAIFEYIDFEGSGKLLGEPDEAKISRCGSYIETDKKHSLQQSDYTVCRKQRNGICFFTSHEQVLARNIEEQDVLIKYLIPIHEREQVLRKLELMGITSYSLFENSENLLEPIVLDLRLI